MDWSAEAHVVAIALIGHVFAGPADDVVDFHCLSDDSDWCIFNLNCDLSSGVHALGDGRIERSHGVDKDRYRKLTTNSYAKEELQAFLIEDCMDYNFYRPHSMLRMLTPVEYLQSIPGYENATLDTSVLYV